MLKCHSHRLQNVRPNLSEWRRNGKRHTRLAVFRRDARTVRCSASLAVSSKGHYDDPRPEPARTRG